MCHSVKEKKVGKNFSDCSSERHQQQLGVKGGEVAASLLARSKGPNAEEKHHAGNGVNGSKLQVTETEWPGLKIFIQRDFRTQ